MLRVNLIADDALDVLEALSDHAQRLPALTQAAYARAIRPLNNRVLNEIKTVPGAPKYPIRWKSDRQRRAFFASNGFGKGIPSQRTGTLLKNWKIVGVKLKDGGGVLLENKTPYMEFVQGTDQQPFHHDTGWVLRSTVVEKYQPVYEHVLMDTFFLLVLPEEW